MKLFSPRANKRLESSSLASDKDWSSSALDLEACSTFLLYTSKLLLYMKDHLILLVIILTNPIQYFLQQIKIPSLFVDHAHYSNTNEKHCRVTCSFSNNEPQVFSSRRRFSEFVTAIELHPQPSLYKRGK